MPPSLAWGRGEQTESSREPLLSIDIGGQADRKAIRHGRDNKLIVWQVSLADEALLDKVLPVDAVASSAKQPWMLHALTVNTLNFCSFAMCRDGMPQDLSMQRALKSINVPDPLLIAVPNTTDSGGIDIYQLPTQVRAAQIHADRSITTGMVMALSILADTTRIQVAAGYESGHTMVFVQNDPAAAFQKLYSAQPHKQPILSISLSPSKDSYLTSSADAIVAKHPLPTGKSIWNTDLKPIKSVQTKHSGQQGLHYRSDGKIFTTAGWDAHIRVYSGKTMKELAVLKWHKIGCFATAFATVESPVNLQSPALGDNEKSAMITQTTPVMTDVQQRRDDKARNTHWLAAGAKDGKVSLWDIY